MDPLKPRKHEPPRPTAPFGSDDVDDRLIKWMLHLTPLERLQVLQDFVDGVTALRNGRRV